MAELARTFLYSLVGCLIVTGTLNPVYPAGQQQLTHANGTLADKLEQLSARYDILIKGLEETRDSPARPVHGPLRRQLQKLLTGFNYVIIQSPDKGIRQVIILSPKDTSPPIPEKIVLATERIGNHYVIHATVVGPKPARIEVPLLVDTGASLVVLPASMIPRLGFAPDDLKKRMLQTANGLIEAKIGQLPAIHIGAEVIRNVETAFIKDALLGGNGLLGMNVLGQYRMIIDDDRNLISLIK